MQSRLVRSSCFLLIAIVAQASPPADANSDISENFCCSESFAYRALAPAPVAFHHSRVAVAVNEQAGSLDRHIDITGAAEYLRHVAWQVAYEKETIRAQLRRLRLTGSPHVLESHDLAMHLVMGPKGLWLHSHLAQFPLGHGALIEVGRDTGGEWQPLRVLIERATKSVYDIAVYFFALDALTRSRAKREAILSAGLFIRQFQELLDGGWNNPDIPISYAMGRGVTPGTEETWIMEPIEEWDRETGLWIDGDTGWLFLRADKRRESIDCAEEALFIVRDWVKRLDQRAIGLTKLPVEVQERIDRDTLLSLVPWLESLSYQALKGVRPGRGRALRPEEVDYILFLIQESQGGSTAAKTPRLATSA